MAADLGIRPASTLVILRERGQGPEVLLTTRARTLRFMAGAVVFPGGAIAPADRDDRWREASVLSPENAASLLAMDDATEALGAFVCALRESFEEVGFWLADGPVENVRREEAADAQRFLDSCLEHGIRLRTDRLVPAGRWVTPLGAPLRFDTWFFAVELHGDWEPEPDASEVERAWWSSPAAALVDLSAGRLMMGPPTVEMLQRLDAHPSIEAIRANLISSPIKPGEVLSVRVSPLVQLVLAPNPGLMTGPGTNTYVVGTDRVVVIDPAVDDVAYLDAILGVADRVDAILITHRHSDHVGGISALASRLGCPVRAFGSELAGGAEVEPLRDEEVVAVGNVALRALHTPGHASDHLCFLLESAATLFAGDNILGEGTAVIAPPDGNMRDYLASLERLRGLRIDRIYPGHFRPLDGGRAVIEHYIAHRRERRDAVIAALGAGATSAPEIVARVYQDTPQNLHPVASFQVEAMLEMLEEEGVVIRCEQRWQLAGVD